MLIKHKLEYTALLGDKIEISLQYFEIEQRIMGYCFLFKQPSCLFLFFCYVDDRGENVKCRCRETDDCLPVLLSTFQFPLPVYYKYLVLLSVYAYKA